MNNLKIDENKVLKYVIIEILKENPKGLKLTEIYDKIENEYKLPNNWLIYTPTGEGHKFLKDKGINDWHKISQNELIKILGNKVELHWKHKVRWMRETLKTDGVFDTSVERGIWKLNEKGKKLILDQKNKFSEDEIKIINSKKRSENNNDDVYSFTPLASDISEIQETKRIEVQIYRIIRDTLIARKLKKIYNDSCQICGKVIKLNDNQTYSEAHHIKPLGIPHNGPDITENIIILCPEHHVLCDYGAIFLDINRVRLEKNHFISKEYIDYHNNYIKKKANSR